MDIKRKYSREIIYKMCRTHDKILFQFSFSVETPLMTALYHSNKLTITLMDSLSVWKIFNDQISEKHLTLTFVVLFTSHHVGRSYFILFTEPSFGYPRIYQCCNEKTTWQNKTDTDIIWVPCVVNSPIERPLKQLLRFSD